MEKKPSRLFFAFSLIAPYPPSYPKARLIPPASRHITLAFVGKGNVEELKAFPPPSFSIAPCAVANKWLFLPTRHPRVVGYSIDFGKETPKVEEYQKLLDDWLISRSYPPQKEFSPHLTMGRSPFDQEEWKSALCPLPLVITRMHLYQSEGDLVYTPLASHSLLPPFEQVEHAADEAFLIRAQNYNSLLTHAIFALSFIYPPLLLFALEKQVKTVDQVIQTLNQIVTLCDLEIGCPIKAISHHGKWKEEENLITWEMIIDV